MDKRYCVFIFLFSLLFLAVSCASLSEEQSSTESPEDTTDPLELIEQEIYYSQGNWNGLEFASEWFGFRYRPTQSMIITSEKSLSEINATQSLYFDGPNAEIDDYSKMQIVYEVIAKSGDGATSLEVLSEKIFADDLTVEQYIDILKQELTSTHGRDISINESSVRLIGSSYYLDLTATINIEGSTVYQTILLSRKGNRIATVLLHYRNSEKLEELLTGFLPY